MPNVIQHKRNSTSGSTPSATGLQPGELAINTADGRLYTKNTSNAVINLPVSSISGTSITPASGNFSSYLAVNSIPVSVSGHTHSSSDLTSIQLRLATSTQWESTNPILASGEPGWDTTNNILKIGNGSSNWNNLTAINYRTNRGSFLLTSSSGTFNVTNGYTVGSLDVFLNGVKLLSDSEYTATNGTSFTLTDPAPSGSVVEYLSLIPGLNISSYTGTYSVFTATDNQPPASAFATLDTRNSIAVLDFDDTTKESAVFVGVMPQSVALASGLSIRTHWMATTATSGDCRWEVSLERCNTDLDSDSFDTVSTGSSTTNGTAGIPTVTSITLTTIDGVTAGDLYRLRVSRDAANGADTMVGDAELLAVEVRSAG